MRALVAAFPSSVLCLILPWELPNDIFLEKKNANNICPKIPQKMWNPVSPKKIGIITVVKLTLQNYIYSNKQSKTVQIIDRTYNPILAAGNINNFMHYLSQQKYSKINLIF
jgi:hypothetical protein